MKFNCYDVIVKDCQINIQSIKIPCPRTEAAFSLKKNNKHL